MIKKRYGSKNALRFISLLCVITFGLMTIVGTGGGGGGGGGDGSISYSGKLDIYIRASKDDMTQRKFNIEFQENVTVGTIRELNFWSEAKLSTYVEPFINYPSGTWQWQMQGDTDKIVYQFTSEGQASYGYTVRPTASTLGSGYCNQDIGVFATYSSFPWSILSLEPDFIDVYLRFDIPEGMEVYSPWIKESDRVIKLKDNGIVKPNYFLTAWGNFSNIEARKHGDHIFYMLGYNTNVENNFAITRFTYDYFMQAFSENYSFLPPANLYIVLPNDEGFFHPLGEGPGGSYLSNMVGENWDPIWWDQPFPCPNDFHYLKNSGDLTLGPVHHIAHATISNFLVDLWPTEGIAVYYSIEMLKRIGIISTNEMEREFLFNLKCYQDEIVGSENDYPLRDFPSFGHDYYVNIMINYNKGALTYTLNELIKNSTNGESELIDLFRSIFNGFKNSNDKSYSNFIRKINQLTGRDFGEFFERFVYSNEPLPLQIEGDEIVLTYFPPEISK